MANLWDDFDQARRKPQAGGGLWDEFDGVPAPQGPTAAPLNDAEFARALGAVGLGGATQPNLAVQAALPVAATVGDRFDAATGTTAPIVNPEAAARAAASPAYSRGLAEHLAGQYDAPTVGEMTVRPDRTWGEALGEVGAAYRQGARGAVIGTLDAPRLAINAINTGGNLAAEALAGLFGQEIPPEQMIAMLERPELLQRLAEATDELHARETAATVSGQTMYDEANRPDDFAGMLAYSAQNPGSLANDAARTVGAMTPAIVPGSGGATVGLQATQQAAMAAEDVERNLLARGVDPQAAQAEAAKAFTAAGAVGAIAPHALRGGRAVEDLLAGRLGAGAGAAVGRVATPLAGEAGSEMLEEGGIHALTNLYSGDPVMQGTGGAAAMGGLLGLGMGAGPAAVEGARAYQDRGRSNAIPEDVLAGLRAALQAEPLVDAEPDVAPRQAAPEPPQASQDDAIAPEDTDDLEALLVRNLAGADTEGDLAERIRGVFGGEAPAPELDTGRLPPLDEPPAPAPSPAPPQGDATTMQNRDRSRAASVAQMQDIRRNPDPERLGFSRDPNTGAPMVGEGQAVPEQDKGRQDTVVMASGRRVPVRYAVVEADQVAASHDADGNVNPGYDAAPLKALNNGRTAGLQAAWASGSTDAYRDGIARDAAIHGVSPEAIASKRQPVLVRLYDPALNTGDMGAESNASAQLGLSPVEQAQTDARALPDLSSVTWAEDGSLPLQGNVDFFRGWFRNMGEAQAATLQDSQGRPNAAAMQRVRAAMVHRAYGDERLLTALAEDVNPDNRNVVNALVQAAPAFATLDQAGPMVAEVREALVAGLELLRDASARGLSLRDAIAQGDLLGRNPHADTIAQFMADNARSAKRMAEAFKAMAAYADHAQAQAATLDVFGNAPEPSMTDALRAANIEAPNEQADTRGAAGNAAAGNRVGEPTAGGRAAAGDAFQLQPQAAPAAEDRREVAPTQGGGLFGAPTQQERIDAARRDRDAERDGRTGTGRTDMAAGPGDLFAGRRPSQADIETGQLPEHDVSSYGQTRPLPPSGEPGGTASPSGPQAGRGAPALRGQLDLFVATRGQQPPSQGHPPAVRIDRGRLAQSARLVETGQFRSGIDRVETLNDAAHILAPLRKSAQERFMVLALDAEGRPLAVMQHTLGGIAESSVYTGMVLGATASIPGVRSVVFAHNHPSGNPEPSRADLALDRKMLSAFRGSGIDVRGSIILQPGRRTFTVYGRDGETAPSAATADQAEAIPARRRSGAVPVVERQIRRVPPQEGRRAVSSPNDARELVQSYRSESSAGVVLLDNRHGVLGMIPFDPQQAERLRTGSLETSHAGYVAAATEANAAAAIVYGDLENEAGIRNMARAMDLADLRVLDTFTFEDGRATSQASLGHDWSSGALESTEPVTSTPEFRRWSGGAPVVAAERAMRHRFETGQPVVVEGFHGSPDARWAREHGIFQGSDERFGMPSDGSDRAFWFASDRGMARSYADDRRAWDYQNAEAGVLHNYVRLDNPLVVDGRGQEWRQAQQRGRTSDVIQQAREDGHDGVVIRNVRDNYQDNTRARPAVTYVVFDPRQIKSATDNSGAFDPDSPSILESVEQSRQRGEDEADLYGLRDAVDAAVGDGRVTYLHGVEGLPERLREGVKRRLEQRGGRGRTAALYDPRTKQVYLFTDVVTSPERAVWNALHEIAGHHGLREFLGDRLAPALELALQNPTVKAVAEAIARERNIDTGTQRGRLLAAEEALAELAAAVRTGDFDHITSRYAVDVPEGIRARLERALENFLRRLKAALDDLFGRPVFTDEDVRGLLEAAWQSALVNGPTMAVQEADGSTASEQVVFHGTPHTVDRFSLQKIGTGEGAQAFGWGLYFASRREVAQHYRDMLTSGPVIRNWSIGHRAIIRNESPVDYSPNGAATPAQQAWAVLAEQLLIDEHAVKEAQQKEGIEGARRVMLGVVDERLEMYGDEESGDYWPEILPFLRSHRRNIESNLRLEVDPNKGNLYRVDVPEDGDLLDWDAPLSEQPEKVRDVLLQFIEDEGGSQRYKDETFEAAPAKGGGSEYRATGRVMYERMASRLGAKGASEFLLAAGIPGLRYLDGNSRSAGDGSRNYVIWDEAAIGEPEVLFQSEVSQTDTAEFRNWFGDSKVVDANGEPLVVYHGTDASNFDAFDTQDFGSWFAENPRTTDDYIDRTSQRDYEEQPEAGAPRVYPVYLSIQNPLRIPEQFDLSDDAEVGELLAAVNEENGTNITAEEIDFPSDYTGTAAEFIGLNDRFIDAAKAAGFDGIHGFEQGEATWNAFEPEQIKSATGNRGTFDPGSDSILESVEYTPEQQEMMRKAGVGADTRSTWRKARDWMAGRRPDVRSDELIQSTLDGYYGLKRAVASKGGLPIDRDPYVAVRMVNIASTMEAILRFGAPKMQGGALRVNRDIPGLYDALKPVADNLPGFFGWMVARRAQVLKKQGRENLLTDADIAAGLSLAEGNEAAFNQAAKDYLRLKNAILDFAEQHGGTIDPVARAAWDHAEYIPFYRADEGGAAGPGTRKGLANQSSGIRALKGGDQALNDPLSNIVQNFTRLMDSALKNRAMLLAVDGLGAAFFEKLPMKVAPATIPLDQVKRHLIEQGVSQETLDAMPAATLKGAARMLSIQAPTGEDVVRVLRDGKPEYYRVLDPLVLRSVSAIHEHRFSDVTEKLVMAPLSWAKNLLTAGATATPDFLIRNTLRDTGEAAVTSRERFLPIVDTMRGAAESLRENELAQDLMMAGSYFHGGLFHQGDHEATARATRRALRKHGLTDSQIERVVKGLVNPKRWWDVYRSGLESSEMGSRVSLARNRVKAGGSLLEGAFEAKDFLDFQLRGDAELLQFFIRVIPFLNARLQGNYRLARAGTARDRRKVVLARMATMALATTALYAWNMLAYGDDYEELPDWEKDAYWHFAPGTSRHIRIPKPFELGLVAGTSVERGLAALVYQVSDGERGDEPSKTWAALLRGVMDTLAVNPIPQGVKPAAELWFNRNTFTGRPIESQADEFRSPSDRVTPRTSPTMIEVSRAMEAVAGEDALSPKQLEHLWRGYTGGMGMYLVSAADWVTRMLTDAPEPPEKALRDFPGIGAIYRGGGESYSSQGVDEFYSLREQAKTQSDRIKTALESGEEARAKRLEAEWGWLVGDRQGSKRAKAGFMHAGVRYLDGVGRDLSKLRKREAEVYGSRSLTPAQKREELDKIARERKKLARQAVNRVKERERRRTR